jgi:hypothetical protein
MLSNASLLLLAGAALAATVAIAEPARADPDATAPAALESAPAAPSGQVQDPGYREAAKPEVHNLMPESGPVDTTVHIMGSNLSAATKVLFGGSRGASFKVLSDSEIEATVPSGALPGPIEIETPAGTVRSSSSFVVAYQ